MKRAFRFHIAYVLLLVFALSGAAIAANPVNLVHMTHAWHGDGWHNFLKEMAEEFNALHPNISVEILIQGSAGDYLDKFRVMTAAGAPPDVTDFASGDGYLALEGMFLDLNAYLDKEDPGMRESILENALRLYSVDEVQWGMPNSLFMVVSWYNENLLNEAGLVLPGELDLSDWNWNTLRDYARKLTLDKAGNGTVDQWGLDRQTAAWLQLIASNGGYMYDRMINPTTSMWNSQQVVDAIEFNRQLMLDDRVASVDWDATTHFWTGRSGMAIVDGPGRLASLIDVDFDWDIAVMPAGPEGCNCGAVSADGFQINAYSENPDAAWEWLKFLTTRQESVASFAVHTGRFPALEGVHEMYPAINPTAPKNWRAFVEAAAHPGVYMAPILPGADRISAVQNQYLSEVWRGTTPTRTAVEQIHERVQAILDESN